MDIMTGKNCRQFSLLTWNSFIGQFVHPVGGDEVKGVEVCNMFIFVYMISSALYSN